MAHEILSREAKDDAFLLDNPAEKNKTPSQNV